MNSFEQVVKWIEQDSFRVACLNAANAQIDCEWFIGAGFVRNLVWDKLQGNKISTPLNDVDVIYFDPSDTSKIRETELEKSLHKLVTECNWSVKNQAMMSVKHGHSPYHGCIEAMSYWPEIQTAIGATMSSAGEIKVVSPFSSFDVIQLSVSRNAKCTSNIFYERLAEKGWESLWPKLRIEM